MRINLQLVGTSQFLQQFRLDVRHKPGKEHIILDALSCLASINVGCIDPSYSELDAFFTYNTTLIEIHPSLFLRILAGYEDDKYWARVHCQVQANKDLGDNKALLLVMTGCFYKSNRDPYMLLRLEGSTNPSSDEGPAVPSRKLKKATPPAGSSMVVIEDFTLPLPDKTKLLYHINRTIGNL